MVFAKICGFNTNLKSNFKTYIYRNNCISDGLAETKFVNNKTSSNSVKYYFER